MVGKIYINGQIGANKDEVGINLIDVIRQVQSQPLATSYDVHINSNGGYVEVGFDIYDYLKSLTVPVNTIGEGIVASIATVVFMAGTTRTIAPNAKFMIHLPSGKVGGTAEEIASYSEMLKGSESRMIKFYTTTTGLAEEAIRPLLKNETWLTNEDALNMNFATSQQVEYSVVAKFETLNTNTDNKMTNEDKGWIEEQFTKFTALFASKPKAIMLLDSTGVEITFPNVMDGQIPAVGDEATVDGNPAEGEYILPQLDGATVVFVAGKVTEIKPLEGEVEIDQLKAENARLTQELADAKAKATTAEVTATEATTKVEAIETQFTAFRAQITAKFDAGKDERKDGEQNGTSTAKERLEKLKNKK